jgi:hypothetical protein
VRSAQQKLFQTRRNIGRKHHLLLLEDAIEKAKSVDLDQLEREIEEKSNQLARQRFKASYR